MDHCYAVGVENFIVSLTTLFISYPHLIEKLIIMNSPHPVAFRQQLSWAQIRRLWFD